MVILTQHQDNLRSGLYRDEKSLNTSNVAASTFGKVVEFAVDGSIYAQPLVAAGIALPGKQPTDVAFIATMHNSVYAFDVTTGKQIWRRKLGDSVQLPNPAIGPTGIDGNGKPSYKDIAWEVGVLSTPAINTTAGAIFVVSTSQDATSKAITHTLWKLGLDGTVQGQQQLAAKFGAKTFTSSLQIQRSGLLLSNDLKTVYLCFAAYGDRDPWQGWVLGYDSGTLAQKHVFCTEPDADVYGAGIWQAGQGPAQDEQGNLYFMTGNSNGPGDGIRPDAGEFGCTVLKLGPTLKVVDFFTPMDAINMSRADDDLGSGGILLIPGTNLAIGGGKTHNLYLMDRTNLGKFSTSEEKVVQKLDVVESSDSSDRHHIHGSPVYFDGPNGKNLFVWPENMEMKKISLSLPGSGKSLTITGRSVVRDPDNFPGGTAGMPGGFLTISANGSPAAPGSAVIWANHPYQGDANQAVRGGVLRAFDPEDISKEIWSSRASYPRDDVGNFAKFCCPTVANGHVYQASMGGVDQRMTTQQQTTKSPALAAQDDKVLELAWTDPGTNQLKAMISPDGLTWDVNSLVTIPSTQSQFQPSLAFDPTTRTTYLAWVNTSNAPQGSGQLVIATSTDPTLRAWSSPLVTPEISIDGPSIAIGAGFLFVAWTGNDAPKSVNIASSLDGGKTWHKKLTLGEHSSSRPSLAFNPATKTLVLAWNGLGNGKLNTTEYTDLEGFTNGKKTTIDPHTTPFGFAVEFDPTTDEPVVIWAGSDRNTSLNAMTSETAECGGLVSPGARFRWFYDDFQSSTDGPVVARYQGRLAMAWVNGGQVNVGVLRRGRVSVYGLLGGSGAAPRAAAVRNMAGGNGSSTEESVAAAGVNNGRRGFRGFRGGKAAKSGGMPATGEKKSKRETAKNVLLCGMRSRSVHTAVEA